jgi:gamma-glutamyltranspeptidase / glutathione hydrolase
MRLRFGKISPILGIFLLMWLQPWRPPVALGLQLTSNQPAPNQPARSRQGMVTSAHPLASQAGLEILRSGGNAVDAAVAAAFMISVVEPYGAGLGGGGFLMLRLEPTPTAAGRQPQILALDFRERAPLLAHRNMYLDAQGKPMPLASLNGHLAVAVPGTVAGLYAAQQRYGKLPWAQVVAPAIQVAEQGFAVGGRYITFMQARQASFAQNPAAKAIFLRPDRDWQPGDRLVQPDLGKTLRAIAQDPQTFYRGWIAKAITQDMAAHGGLISERDLAAYRPIWRKPLCGAFRQYQVCSMPPPSSGGVSLLQMLNMLAASDLNPAQPRWGRYHPNTLHLLAGIMQIAYADRATYLGDPAFTRIPVLALISPAYARLRHQEVNLQQARAAGQVRAATPATLARFNRPESAQTSHLTVVDANRNAASLTFTINTWFGAAVVTPGTGILLNNEMNDFALAPGVANISGLVGSEANAIAPGKTPLSSMTPILVSEQGQFRLAAGAPGGSTIITTMFQLLVNVYLYRMDAGSAIAAPRIHQQWLPDQLRLEQGQFPAPTLQELRRRGNPVTEREAWGNGNVILVTPDQHLEGAADPRGEGRAVGY